MYQIIISPNSQQITNLYQYLFDSSYLQIQVSSVFVFINSSKPVLYSHCFFTIKKFYSNFQLQSFKDFQLNNNLIKHKQIILLNRQLMNQQELNQRQQQIYKLHKRIKQYKLTYEEEKQLKRNKEDQEAQIQSKYIASKTNANYKFPKLTIDDDLPTLGYKDICNLYDINTIDSSKKNTLAFMSQACPKKPHKITQQFCNSLTDHSVKANTSICRQSYSPGINQTFDSRVSLDKKYLSKPPHFLSANHEKSQTLRLMTDIYDSKSKQNNNQPMCQSIKSIIRVKNKLSSTKRTQGIFSSSKQLWESKSKIETSSTKLSETSKYKSILNKKGKQNHLKSKYVINAKSYNSNTTLLQHNKSLKQWNKSLYNTNNSVQKSITTLYSTVKNKEGFFQNTQKCLNRTEMDENIKISLAKYEENKKFIKKKEPKTNERSALNLTTSLKTRISEPKQQSYFCKVFNSMKSKNVDNCGSQSVLKSSCSRLPIVLSSPLSSKYFQYKHNLNLTNR